ncbi:MAG TPA: FtsH protease activity modulator HflK [Stellaceae bacterium]|jgi:membrane protease subunit HflK|nr:FtsH protease activity modulator HflK [Stellaceae bacterium]
MPWTNQSGGGGGPWGGGQSPWGRPSQGPKVEDIIKRSQEKLRGVLPGGFGSMPGFLIILVIAILLWGFSGVYQVQPDELGVVLRFGAVNRIALPGLRYHIPAPVESVERPKVTRVNRVEIGFRLGDNGRTTQDLPRESLMLTGDENIVDINFTVFWVISDAKRYLFNIRDPDQTVKAAAESAMREVIGHTEIASALAEGRAKIEIDTQKLSQEILDFYESGISVQQVQLQKVDPPPQVIDAFRDVQSAKIDFTRLQNEADAYQNDVVPQAQGEAARIVQEAEAYKAQIVNQAQGDAQRFISVYNAYIKAPDVTGKRLYIDTIQTILKNSNKIILDRAASSSGVLPYLPLPEIKGVGPSTGGRAAGAGANPPSGASARSVKP